MEEKLWKKERLTKRVLDELSKIVEMDDEFDLWVSLLDKDGDEIGNCKIEGFYLSDNGIVFTNKKI